MRQIFKNHKISVFILTILSSIIHMTNAQSTYITPLVNQVFTNFHYGNSNSEVTDDKKHVTGYMAGISFQAGITPYFSIVTETYFTMKGGTLKNNNRITEGESTIRLYNVEAPLLARLHLNNIYINAGPYASFAVAGKIKIDETESHPTISKSINFNNGEEGFKRWELGLQAGAGYNFHIGKTKLALEMRYGYGLTNISSDVSRYNRSLNLSVLIIKNWKTNPFARKKI